MENRLESRWRSRRRRAGPAGPGDDRRWPLGETKGSIKVRRDRGQERSDIEAFPPQPRPRPPSRAENRWLISWSDGQLGGTVSGSVPDLVSFGIRNSRGLRIPRPAAIVAVASQLVNSVRRRPRAEAHVRRHGPRRAEPDAPTGDDPVRKRGETHGPAEGPLDGMRPDAVLSTPITGVNERPGKRHARAEPGRECFTTGPARRSRTHS